MYFTSISTKYLLQKKSHKKVFFLNGGRNLFFLKNQFFLELFPVKSMILLPVTDAKTSERTARGNAIAENKITNC